MGEDKVSKDGDGDKMTPWSFAISVGDVPGPISMIMPATSKHGYVKELIRNVHNDLVPVGEFGFIQ